MDKHTDGQTDRHGQKNKQKELTSLGSFVYSTITTPFISNSNWIAMSPSPDSGAVSWGALSEEGAAAIPEEGAEDSSVWCSSAVIMSPSGDTEDKGIINLNP